MICEFLEKDVYDVEITEARCRIPCSHRNILHVRRKSLPISMVRAIQRKLTMGSDLSLPPLCYQNESEDRRPDATGPPMRPDRRYARIESDSMNDLAEVGLGHVVRLSRL